MPATTGRQLGDPASPFPWLTWNDRLYVSPLELMQVSWLSSSKLLATFNTNTGSDPYANPSQPFPHLLGLFPSGGATGSFNEELHRVLEYLGVPSPFVGTETWTNPSSATDPYLPPFNRISNYREPGRINLNTIYQEEVFNGLKAGCPGATPTWTEFVRSRRGYDAKDIATVPANQKNILEADPHTDSTKPYIPTEFAHPFRSYTGATLVPSGIIPALRRIPIVRSTPHCCAKGRRSNVPVDFDGSGASDEHQNASNPYFRYQALQRLGSLATTRSNVYAVWITVGYFEVTQNPAGVDAGHPDGYRLGRELGIDTGNIERHRAFYIIDRTIPVGFQRGQDMNAEKAILLNRFIE